MNSQAAALLEYLTKVHQRTMRAVRSIPSDQVEWRPKEGAFSLGDLARHMAVTLRYTFAENIAGRPSLYSSHGPELAASLDEIIALMEASYAGALGIFSEVSEEEWDLKCNSADGVPVTRWKLLRLAIEHEIHHRGELYAYLGLAGVKAPPIFGLTSEELRARAAT